MTIKKGNVIIAGLVLTLGTLFTSAIGTYLFGMVDRTVRKEPRREPPRPGRKFREIDRRQTLRGPVPAFSTDCILVKFRPAISARFVRSTLAAYGSRQVVSIPAIGMHKVQVPPQTSVTEFLTALKRNPDVQYAEPDYTTRIQITPNDEFFRRQYGLHNSGGEINLPGSPQAKARADIKAVDAWEQTRGDSNVIIAVLDTGVDMDHPDIKNKISSRGRDFINNDDDATDDHWHGTHVAGIAAAETDNGQGIAGTAWSCRILPVKVIDENGLGFYSQLIDGLLWAADNGAQVINMSLGGDEPSESLLAALQYAYDKGTIIVASAGNEGDSVLYPAAYDATCLAVGATDYNDERTTWSNPGSQVDVAAPGEDILSLIPTWYFGPDYPPYAFASGTSMSAPFVSGFAALIKSLKPWLTNAEIMDIIRFSADDVNGAESAGKDDFIGYGRINMDRALSPYKLK